MSIYHDLRNDGPLTYTLVLWHPYKCTLPLEGVAHRTIRHLGPLPTGMQAGVREKDGKLYFAYDDTISEHRAYIKRLLRIECDDRGFWVQPIDMSPGIAHYAAFLFILPFLPLLIFSHLFRA